MAEMFDSPGSNTTNILSPVIAPIIVLGEPVDAPEPEA